MAGSYQIGVLAHTMRLRERVTFQRVVYVDTGGGSRLRTIVDGATVRARVALVGRGREHLTARQMVGGSPYEVTMRYPLPSGESLTTGSAITWHAVQGDLTLHLQEPPQVFEDNRYMRFIAVVREDGS